MEPFSTLKSTAILLAKDDIDTDQIIPARYLKVTDKAGLAEGLFSGWRYQPDGRLDPDFPLNRSEMAEARILVSGNNFGCGSSREHAPWALVGWGFKAVISTSFADIFRSNALKNGLLPVTIDPDSYQKLVEFLEEVPHSKLVIDLASQTLELPDGKMTTFPIDPFHKTCLLQGVDSLGYLLKHMNQIEAFESTRS
jgi:3-isopropylmalate/(R)-2-methylmalate dehydratase small subunit